jgi:hypothetical protein
LQHRFLATSKKSQTLSAAEKSGERGSPGEFSCSQNQSLR